MKNIICIVMLISLCGTPSFSQETIMGDGKPPLKPIRILGELVVGSVGMIIAFPIAYSTGGGSSLKEYAIGAATVSLGSAVGVSLIGRLGNETGSFWYSYLGSSIGLATTIFVGRPDIDNGTFAYWLLVPVGSVIGFNLTRKYEDRVSVNPVVVPGRKLVGLQLKLALD